MSRCTLVFGPAYLDRVLRVGGPLLGPEQGGPLDQSVEGRWTFGAGLRLVDPAGSELTVALPDDWPGPEGTVALASRVGTGPGGWRREAAGVAWHDDLGGMGAGYAAAMGGELVSAVGPDSDPITRTILDRLKAEGIAHLPLRVESQPADWTLLITSGPHGDKLPVGFRGCHAGVDFLGPHPSDLPCDVRVVTSLPNRLAAEALVGKGAGVRVFAPAMRNMTDTTVPVASFAGSIDVLCCNRREWESLEGREQVAWAVSLLVVTDGPNGCTLRFTTPEGDPGRVTVPAFPRDLPPTDTNRAGEAFASTLLNTLLDHGWAPGVTDPDLARHAALRASAAAALVLDMPHFGFPTPAEVNAALAVGRVAGRPTGAETEGPGYNPPVADPSA